MSDAIRDARRRIDSWIRAGGRADDAVAAASRIALFAAVPDMERSYDTVRRGDAPRTPASADAPAQATRVHEVLFIVATVLGLVAPGLVALSPRSGDSALSIDAGTLPAGLCAVVTLGLFVWLEPYRRSSRFFAEHNAPPRLYLVYGIMWLLLGASIVLLRWREVDEPGPVIVGLMLMAVSAVGAVPLWLRARRADASSESVQLDGAGVDMTRWWRGADGVLTPQERAAVGAAYRAAIERLRERSVLSAADADAALSRDAQDGWKQATN